MPTHERRLHLLLLDDDPDDRALVRLVLARELPEADVEEVTDAPAFARACGRRSFDVVILERRLRWAEGLDLLALLREEWPQVPVIVLTGPGGEETALRAMRLGAADYLVKNPAGFLRLPLAVRTALEPSRAQDPADAAPLRSLLDQGRIAVFSATPEGRLLQASPGFLQLLGVETATDAAELDLKPLAAAAAQGAAPREIGLRRADGRTVWVQVLGNVVRANGETRVDGLVEDITARRQAQEEMVRQSMHLQRSNEELRQFTSIASHELQEPVRMMERYTRLLTEELAGKLGSEGGELLEIVTAAAHRLRRLIESLLALSRAETRELRIETASAETVLTRALADLQEVIEESGATIESSPLPEIEGDLQQIAQVFENLLGNAIKFRGGEPPRVHVSAERGPREWIFAVRDNGRGLPPAEAESIFTIFKRLHPEVPGSGIGLALCRKIVERHGGRIWAKPLPSGGSAFFFTLPVSSTD
ncbi:MAG TPA: ATP-binding protein [Thermoanaerobaculia bacterium]